MKKEIKKKLIALFQMSGKTVVISDDNNHRVVYSQLSNPTVDKIVVTFKLEPNNKSPYFRKAMSTIKTSNESVMDDCAQIILFKVDSAISYMGNGINYEFIIHKPIDKNRVARQVKSIVKSIYKS